MIISLYPFHSFINSQVEPNSTYNFLNNFFFNHLLATQRVVFMLLWCNDHGFHFQGYVCDASRQLVGSDIVLVPWTAPHYLVLWPGQGESRLCHIVNPALKIAHLSVCYWSKSRMHVQGKCLDWLLASLQRVQSEHYSYSSTHTGSRHT